MLEQLETLVALVEEGTMARAALRLRVTQGTVSKRLAALEVRLRRRLLQPRGRRVELTAEGERLVQRAGPLLDELRAALHEPAGAGLGRLAIGVSESVLGSWGAGLLARVRAGSPGLELELHAHRSPVVLERVRAGEYSLGLCAGLGDPGEDLAGPRVLDEPMVLVPSGLGPRPRRVRGRPLPILTIEASSATWRALEGRARALGLAPAATLESFFAVAQAAVQGFGHGLVPLGVARALGIPAAALGSPGRGGMTRPVRLVARRRTLARPGVRAFQARLMEEAAAGLAALLA